MSTSNEVNGSGVPSGSANAAQQQVGNTAEPTVSATSRKEQVMNDSTEGPAEPTASATIQSKEQVMSTSDENPTPSHGAPNESASSHEKPAEANPDDSTSEDPKKKRSENFVPTSVIKKGEKWVKKAKGNTNPEVSGCVTRVQNCSAPMMILSAAVGAAADDARDAFAAWKVDEAKLETEAKPLLGVIKATHGGRAFVRASRRSTFTVTVANTLHGISEGDFAVPDKLLKPTQAALTVAEASKSTYDKAQEAKSKAAAKYMAAKGALETAISALIASLENDKFSQRAAALVPNSVTPPAPPPPELNGRSPSSGAKAASKSAKRGANGVKWAGH